MGICIYTNKECEYWDSDTDDNALGECLAIFLEQCPDLDADGVKEIKEWQIRSMNDV